jgi:hypothetical protein
MKRLSRFLRQPEFPIVLFAVSVALFHWHLAGSPGREGGVVSFLWLYASWAFVILLLYLAARALARKKDDEDEDDV